AGATAREAVGEVAAAIRAKLQRTRGLEEAVLPFHGEPAPMLARTSGVRHVAVALNEERILRLDHLDRIVGEVDHARAAGVHAVLGGSPAPGAEEELEEYERPPLAIVAAEADAGVTAHLTGEDAVGGDLGQRAEERVGEAEAGEAARGYRSGHHGIHAGAGWSDHLDGTEVTLVVRRVAPDQGSHGRGHRRLGEGQRRVDPAPQLGGGGR